MKLDDSEAQLDPDNHHFTSLLLWVQKRLETKTCQNCFIHYHYIIQIFLKAKFVPRHLRLTHKQEINVVKILQDLHFQFLLQKNVKTYLFKKNKLGYL